MNVAAGDYHPMPTSKGHRHGETAYLPAEDAAGVLRGGPDLGALTSR